MNEHIQKGKEALERDDLQTAKDEFNLAMRDPNPIVQRIAKGRLNEIKYRELSESKTRKSPEIQNVVDSSKSGLLSDLGYRVGNNGIPKKERRDILREAFYQTILKEARWGPAGSRKRFEKLRSWLNFRISSNDGKFEMTNAVNDWREDLKWIESEFSKEVFPGNSPR
jgi:hypothetical protein